jgi:uncharacterized SAM-binding protein YcdF (DUF218 family)
MKRRREASLGALTGALLWFLVRDLDLTALASFWGERVVLLPFAIVLGAACALTRLRIPLFVTASMLASLWIVVLLTPLNRWLLDGLVRRDPLRPADAVLVLATRMQDDGDPTSTQLPRLLNGIEIAAQGYTTRVVITELPAPEAAQEPYARVLMKRLGVEAELIVLPGVRNTHDETRDLADLFRRRGWRTVILSTAPYHSKRGAALLEKSGLDVISSPSIETRADLETLARPEDRLWTFGALMHEHLGLWLYRRRGWI